MKTSGIGGQAVIEGIMMRNKDKYAIAVRKPDKEIELLVKESKLLTDKYKWLNFPIIRGVVNFADSLISGISTISYSASFYDDPEEQDDTKIDKLGKAVFKDKLESVLMALTIMLSAVLAIALFMVVPYGVSRLLAPQIASEFLLNFIEGVVRVLIFLIYIVLISQMKDIKRTFMYHGAEHKCINCIENGARLTPENVKNSSRYHKRCGTSFMFLVMFISVIFFIFIRVENTVLQLVLRILLIPVIAGVSYEVIKWAGKSDNIVVKVISFPGMLLQKLTTKEPDMDMIEVAIKAVEAVFDVEAFLEAYYADSEDAQTEMAIVEEQMALAANVNVHEEKKSRVIKFDKPQGDDEDEDDTFFNQEEFNSHYEDDNSESTEYDNESDESDEGSVDDKADERYESDDYSDDDYVDESANGEFYDNIDDAFIFEEEGIEEEDEDAYAEELPVFKQRRTE